MRRWLICLIFFSCCLAASSQVNLYRGYVYNRSDVTKLAKQITHNATTDSQKVANIHFWITHHIKYDAKRFVRWNTNNQETKDVLRRRKTLCSGYSNLFQDLCVNSGVNAIVINGYTKNAFVDVCDTAYLPDHAWNKVNVDGRWHNIDNTWDAGYVEYYKTSFTRRIVSRLTFRLVKPIIYKPHFIKNPQNRYFLVGENNFAVDHFPENSQLVAFNTNFSSNDFDRDSAFYFYNNVLQKQQSVRTNTYYSTYSGLDAIEQDKNDGKNAQLLNNKNYFGLARFHYHELFEKWEKYVDDPKEMRLDSNYLKGIIVMSDSVLNNTSKNDSLIWEMYKDLSTKYRKKEKIHRTYNSTYVRYLKRKHNHQRIQINKIDNKKSRSKSRARSSDNWYSRLLWRHFYRPGKWPIHPNQSKADSLALVFRLFNDSLIENQKQITAINLVLQKQMDSICRAISNQASYISSVGGHFYGLALTRMAVVDDYDLPIHQQKQHFIDYVTSDSTIRLEEAYQDTYTLMDSMYRLGRNQYRYMRRQKSVLKRVNRSTGWKTLYYALNDEFRKNLSNAKQVESDVQKDIKLQLKHLKKATKGAAPVSIPLDYCEFEKAVVIPLSIIQNKHRKHSKDNKQLEKFAKRCRVKANARLEILRMLELEKKEIANE
ncbi:MAG: hypothetical protein ACI9JN_001539 [Bacteroidia bacterium]|jgi:hypothetical protein